jgi:hypothetical protein
MQIESTPVVTWQRSCDSDAVLCPDPVLTKSVIPDWFKTLRSNFGHYSDHPDYQKTVRHCLGLRGAMSVGWTIPWKKGFIRGVPLHQEQIHGSIWAEQSDDQYQWHLHIMCWPWRVRLPKGWRLYITTHPLTWSHDWFSFTGCVDSNYHVIDNTNVGSFWNYEYTIDPDYCYFNIENVMAFRERDGYDSIEEGTPLFSAIPIYDPDYAPVVHR